MEIQITNSQKTDLQAIVEIYNWAIENTTATFDTELKTVDSYLPWFEEHDEEYPIITVKTEGKVVAWGSISRWSDRCAYSGTGEVSFYVHPDYQGKGIGTQVLESLVKIGRQQNFRTLVSRIAGDSDASIYLHKKLGFSDIGVMKKVGKKFGKTIDVHLMQILF